MALVEHLRDETHVLDDGDRLAVADGDARGLLAAVLERVQPEIGLVGDGLPRCVDAEDAAGVARTGTTIGQGPQYLRRGPRFWCSAPGADGGVGTGRSAEIRQPQRGCSSGLIPKLSLPTTSCVSSELPGWMRPRRASRNICCMRERVKMPCATRQVERAVDHLPGLVHSEVLGGEDLHRPVHAVVDVVRPGGLKQRKPSRLACRGMTPTTGFCLWFTGLSGAGKSTIANLVVEELRARGHRVELLDGDELRENLSKGLGFSKEDRDINIRRIGFVAGLLSRNGVVAVTAAISPYRAVRDEVRGWIDNFVEIHVATSLEDCEARDVKGLYAKARAGEIPEFTGVSDPYEPPLEPEIRIETAGRTPEESAARSRRLARISRSQPARA